MTSRLLPDQRPEPTSAPDVPGVPDVDVPDVPDVPGGPGLPADGLADLHRSGELAAHYPAVAGLLAGTAGPEFDRAGRLLATLDPAAVLAAHPATPVLTVAVTGHGTLGPLVPPLTAEFARHGILARPVVGDFDGWVFSLGDPDSALYAAKPDLTLCLLDPRVVFDEVPVPWRPEDVRRVFEEKLQILERLAGTFGTAGSGTLVLNTLPLPRRYPAQLVDHRSRAELGALWREANARLLGLAASHPAVVVLDLDPLAAEGVAALDARLSVYAKVHLSPPLLAAYAREVGHLARHLVGAGKKCLVLDLDGTVWGGILGEDGYEGIEIADSYRGEAHRAFQRVARQLGSQGVLLAVASKNEIELVRQALRERPEMTLREDDFVRITANWRPKPENLAELAADLNIGLDSLVFVDDSRYECELVRAQLPGVTVVQVDGDPVSHVDRLLADGWFDTRALTAADQTRTQTYRDELVRKDFLAGFDSIRDYLHELGVQVLVADVAPRDVERVSQLTLRTNQFNLTTERLQRGDVEDWLAAPDRRVLTVRSADRFGDNGLVGAVFLRADGPALRIENFVLSCRVFSRGIEQACLAAVAGHARAEGFGQLTGRYRRTAKNSVVHQFYPVHGFDRVDGDDDAATYRHDPARPLAVPDHIDLRTSITGGT